MNLRLLLPVLVVAAAACANVPQNAPPAPVIVAEFDPGAAVPIVPTPNDLAKDATTGHITVPIAPGESPAQTEFDQTYLGSLTGFPFESTGEALVSGDLDPTTVSTKTVLAFDLGTTAAPSQTPVAIAPTYDAASRAIVVPPPSGSWTRAHGYALVLVGGPGGLRGAQGEDVVGSETWALVSSSTPLVTCQDLASPDCRPAVDVIPSSVTDPAARLADQTKTAIQLEQLRRLYAPLLDALAQGGLPRDVVPLAWTFTVLDDGEATFDPATGVVPFPNDVLRSGGKVRLPNPKTLQPLTPGDCTAPTDPLVQITCGLDTLDGFSTLAPPVSESSDALGAAMQATLDASSLSPASVGLVPLASQAPAGERTKPAFTPCLNCLSSADANGNPQVSPQQLQWKLDAPLDEKTTYLAYVTSDVQDDRGKPLVANPVFAMLRLTSPLFDGTRSTLPSLLTDAQAQQLEPLRAAMKPALDALELGGVPRAKLALAFAFTTQSEATVLDQLYGYPTSLAQTLPDAPLYLVDATAQYQAIASAGSIPFGAVGSVWVGAFVTPVAVTGPGGTLDPTKPTLDRVPFVLYLPASAAPAKGYPLAVFGHDLTGWRNHSIAIANALASAGQATIAMDELDHGERSSCTGSKAATQQSSDDASCAAPATQTCNEDPLVGRCVARSNATRAACNPAVPASDLACAAQGQGRCSSDGMCEGGDFLRDAAGKPVISGWNVISLTNFFATRDDYRQQVIDLAQLERVIAGQGASSLSALAGSSFDATKLGFVGQGLGSITGSLELAVSPRITNAALNAGGGALVQIILTAPAFATQRAALLATLAQLGLQPGTPAFDRFLGIAQWILDPADPANVGYRLTHGVSVTQGTLTYTAPNAARAAFLQFIEGDQVVPNVSNVALVAGANRTFTPTPPGYGCVAPLYCYELTEAGDGFDATTATPATRHGFLLSPPSGTAGLALTSKAQTQVATFLATGQLP